jgi:hypothetical protein
MKNLTTSELLFLQYFHQIVRENLKRKSDAISPCDLLENLIRPGKEQSSNFSQFFKNICKISIHDPVLDFWCRHSKLENYWLNQWNSRPEAGFKLEPQPCFSNFDLVCGDLFYEEFIKTQDFLYLSKAIEFNSFYAIKDFISYLFKSLEEKKPWDEISLSEVFSKLVTLQEKLVLHGSPGCFLISGAYIRLSKFYKDRQDKTILYKMAYTQRYAAHLLQTFSSEATANATLGRGIQIMNRKKTDNLLSLCEELASHLKPLEKSTAQEDAKLIKNAYLIKISKSQENSSDPREEQTLEYLTVAAS